MTESLLSHKELSSISVNDITRFLLRRGFSLIGIDKQRKNNIFRKNFHKYNQIIDLPIPIDEQFSDYADRIETVIIALSIFFETDQFIIYKEILHSINDIMKLRVLNPGEYQHSLPLDYASREIDGLKNLFLYSACSEVIELPYFDKPLPEGLKHIQKCQFGHTFEGSFGFTINVPLVKQDQLLLIEDSLDIPYERKVSERIVRGLISIQDASAANSSDPIVKTFETGLNARMCDSLLDMSIEKTKEIEISAEWSPEYIPDPEIQKTPTFRVGPKEYEIIEDASSRLKKIEPFEQTIIGNVITLHSKNDPNLEEDFLRTIVMRHEYEGKTVEVKIYLKREDYLLAYTAHGSGRKIEVHGKLFRIGSTWKMDQVTSVTYFA